MTQLSNVLTLLLTALSILRIVKTYSQVGIDTLLIKKAEMDKTRAPLDVLRRKGVLEEHAITRVVSSMIDVIGNNGDNGDNNNGKRRGSMGSMGLELTELQTQSVTIEKLPALPQRPVSTKKKRRLSSRELMQQQNVIDGDSTVAVTDDIELTELGLIPNDKGHVKIDEETVKRLQQEMVQMKKVIEEQRELQQLMKNSIEQQKQEQHQMQKRYKEQEKRIDRINARHIQKLDIDNQKQLRKISKH